MAPRKPPPPPPGGGGGGGVAGKAPRKCRSGFRWNKKMGACVVIAPGQPGFRQNVWDFVGRNPKATTPRIDKARGWQASQRGANEGDLLGVGEDYTVTLADGTVAAPRYREGNEIRALVKIGADRGQLADLQVALVEAGYLSEEAFNNEFGSNGKKTRDAMKALMTDANVVGGTWSRVLEERLGAVGEYGAADDGGGGGGGGGGGAAQAIELSNPDDIKAVATTVGREVLGRRLNEEESNAIVAAFHDIERGYQTEAYGVSEAGGTITAPPSLETYVENRLKLTNPKEAVATDVRSFVDEWNDLLASSRPTTGGAFSS